MIACPKSPSPTIIDRRFNAAICRGIVEESPDEIRENRATLMRQVNFRVGRNLSPECISDSQFINRAPRLFGKEGGLINRRLGNHVVPNMYVSPTVVFRNHPALLSRRLIRSFERDRTGDNAKRHTSRR